MQRRQARCTLSRTRGHSGISICFSDSLPRTTIHAQLVCWSHGVTRVCLCRYDNPKKHPSSTVGASWEANLIEVGQFQTGAAAALTTPRHTSPHHTAHVSFVSHGLSFFTVENFWSHYKHVQPPSRLDLASNYHLFKCNIKPMWEDEQNLGGGRIVSSSTLPPASRATRKPKPNRPPPIDDARAAAGPEFAGHGVAEPLHGAGGRGPRRAF